MGITYIADVPDNTFQRIFTVASVDSDGANAEIASAGFIAPNSIMIDRAWYMPWANACTHGTDTSSASYKRINLLNGGTSGTGTTIMASCNITASIASRGSKAFTTTSNNTASAGEILYFSALTVGGTDDDCSTMQDGVLQIEYELL